MLWDSAHSVIGNSCWYGTAQPRIEREQGVEPSFTAVIQVNVNAAVVYKDKVTYRICALDVVWVLLERLEKPRIFCLYKVVRFCVGPEHVLVVGMEVEAGLLRGKPSGWYSGVYVGLVDDLRDELWRRIRRGGIWS